MDVKEFFELSAGKWFSQRTSYNLTAQTCESSQSELAIALLSPDDPTVNQLCQQAGVEPAGIGVKITWQQTSLLGKTGNQGSTLLVFLPQTQQANAGQLLRSSGQTATAPIMGRYLLAEDEALNLMAEADNTAWEERLWFASENLRLRTVYTRSENWSYTAFYSDIRKLSS